MSKFEMDKKTLIIIIVAAVVVVAIALTVTLVLVLKKNKGTKINYCDPKKSEKECWEKAYKKANTFISKCNLTERVNLLFGTENMKEITPILNSKTREADKQWLCVGRIDPFKNDKGIDFNGICLQDGPAGIRFANGTGISWQASINTAATFNKDLMYKIGKAQGEESKERGIHVLLGPCLNMLRNPQGGRSWESFGEDPYLTGVAGALITQGIQESGVIASIKHYVGNDQETYRKASSSNINYQALMDVYVEPFFRAIKYGHAGCVMASYNAINDSYVYENKTILTDILRGILNFQGFVVSDWWEVVSDAPEIINSGLDMNMPGGFDEGPYDKNNLYAHYGRENSYWTHLEDFVKQGKVQESRITEAATRIIAAMYQMEQMKNYPSINMYKETKTKERIALQRKAATESQVLLKNDGILPLDVSSIRKLAIIGSDAGPRDCIKEGDFQCKNSTNEVYNGHIPLGYGSGTTKFGYLIDPLQAISNLCQQKGIEVISSIKLIYTDEERNGKTVHTGAVENIAEGVSAAENADIAIIFLSANSGEEYIQLEGTIGDRPDLLVWHNGGDLVNSVATKNPNVIVVINAPGPVKLGFLDKARAVIYSGFPGAESGNAIADILFGIANPSGHLPFVWANLEDYDFNPIILEDLSIVDQATKKTWKDIHRYNGVDSIKLQDPENDKHQIEYTEGIYIGQRSFNKRNKTPTFPFGYGLSYTKFLYSNLKTTVNKDGLLAKFSIKNIGEREGMATPMMFITFPDYIGDYPKHILKGFEKVNLKVDEVKEVEIKADDHALSYFSLEKNNYERVNKGVIVVCIAENGDPSSVKLKSEVEASY